MIKEANIIRDLLIILQKRLIYTLSIASFKQAYLFNFFCLYSVKLVDMNIKLNQAIIDIEA